MAGSKKYPINIRVCRDSYDGLINALRENERQYFGSTTAEFIANEAAGLIEHIETNGKCKEDRDGNEVYSLGFSAKEGKQFITQFIASAAAVEFLREQNTELRKKLRQYTEQEQF